MLGRNEVNPVMRVLVVDERTEVRAALAATLQQEGVGPVRTAADAETALELVKTWHPDVVLVEVKRRDGRGVELCRRIRERAPQALILVVTSYPDPLERLEAIRAGADGYLLKEPDPSPLIGRIRQLNSW